MCYSRANIPVHRNQILRKESILDIPLIKDLDNPDYYPNLAVGLLLGTNCMSALQTEPR